MQSYINSWNIPSNSCQNLVCLIIPHWNYSEDSSIKREYKIPILRDPNSIIFWGIWNSIMHRIFWNYTERTYVCSNYPLHCKTMFSIRNIEGWVGKSTAGWSEDYEQLSNDQPAVVATSRITIDNNPGYS